MSPPPDDPADAASRARLRVNLQAGEFEVEGREAFVERYAQRIEALLTRIEQQPPVVPTAYPATGPIPTPSPAPGPGPGDDDDTFGELLQALPRAASDVDRMLLAGWYLQKRTDERSFATADANRLLLEQGVKLGNPSQSVKQNLMAKRAFLVTRGRYRVAQVGLAHLEQLTSRRLADG